MGPMAAMGPMGGGGMPGMPGQQVDYNKLLIAEKGKTIATTKFRDSASWSGEQLAVGGEILLYTERESTLLILLQPASIRKPARKSLSLPPLEPRLIFLSIILPSLDSLEFLRYNSIIDKAESKAIQKLKADLKIK